MRRLKDYSIRELCHIAWCCENADEAFERTKLMTIYYAAVAVDNYGSACRDNTFHQLVAIGKRIEREGGTE